MNWQPIETAPVEPSDSVPGWYRFRCLLANEHGWVNEGYAEYTHKRKDLVWKNAYGQKLFPTHWMPLPSPPNSEDAG